MSDNDVCVYEWYWCSMYMSGSGGMRCVWVILVQWMQWVCERHWSSECSVYMSEYRMYMSDMSGIYAVCNWVTLAQCVYLWHWCSAYMSVTLAVYIWATLVQGMQCVYEHHWCTVALMQNVHEWQWCSVYMRDIERHWCTHAVSARTWVTLMCVYMSDTGAVCTWATLVQCEYEWYWCSECSEYMSGTEVVNAVCI
jgi:hypothetical protein